MRRGPKLGSWKKHIVKVGRCWLFPKTNYSHHREIWEETFGPIPDRLIVMHLCNNKQCVKPSHLVLGSRAANLEHAFLTGYKISEETRRKQSQHQTGRRVTGWHHTPEAKRKISEFQQKRRESR